MLRTVFVFALAMLMIAGCSQSETVAVTGTVTLDGKPVENAEVFFNPKAGRMATGVTDATGHFSIATTKPNDGAKPGDYVVTLGEYYPAGVVPPLPKDGGQFPSRFPPQYGDPARSPLTVHVERGAKNDFPIELKK